MSAPIKWWIKASTPSKLPRMNMYLREVMSEISALTPEAIDRLSGAAADPGVQYYERDETLIPEKVRNYLTTAVHFRIKARMTFGSCNIAHAYCSDSSVHFNPYWVENVVRHLSRENSRVIILDMIMHELAHLLTSRFLVGDEGHGKSWKSWARAAGFVPYGSTSDAKRLQLARRLQFQGTSYLKAAAGESKKVSLSTTPVELKSPADLARKLLLTGASNQEVRDEVHRAYPNYGAWKICASVYRRELKGKGQL